MVPPSVNRSCKNRCFCQGDKSSSQTRRLCFLYFPCRLADLSLDRGTQWDIVKRRRICFVIAMRLGLRDKIGDLVFP